MLEMAIALVLGFAIGLLTGKKIFAKVAQVESVVKAVETDVKKV